MQYQITVKTGVRQPTHLVVDPQDPTHLTAFLHAKPHNNEANVELLKTLSEYFKVPKTAIKITRGAKSHTKTVIVSV